MGTITKIIAAIAELIAGPLGLPITVLMIFWALTDVINFIRELI